MIGKLVLLTVLVGVVLADHYKPKYDHHGVAHHGSHHGFHHGYDGHHHNNQHSYDHGNHDNHHGYDHGHHGHHGHRHHGYDHHDNIDYKFKYDVKDDKTYNYQSREEYKDGKNVYGSYSLVEPDGKTRIVKYKADDYGFHADVDYKGGYNHGYHGHTGGYKQDYLPKHAYHKHTYERDYKY